MPQKDSLAGASEPVRISPAVAPPQSRRWFHRRAIWLLAAVLAFAVWIIMPPSHSRGGIHFTIHRAGTPGVLTFLARDSRDHPLPGVTVISESFSGTTEEVITDSSGVATIQPGESEALAVYINGQEFRLSWPGIFEHFAPDCSGGLTFRITIRDAEGK